MSLVIILTFCMLHASGLFILLKLSETFHEHNSGSTREEKTDELGNWKAL